MEMGNENHELGTVFLYKGVTSAVKTVKFISYRMPFIIPRCCWCNIVLNLDAPTEDKTDNTKNSFYEELEHVFTQFLKYHIQILLHNFGGKTQINHILIGYGMQVQVFLMSDLSDELIMLLFTVWWLQKLGVITRREKTEPILGQYD
jgi:hypothetical protein